MQRKQSDCQVDVGSLRKALQTGAGVFFVKSEVLSRLHTGLTLGSSKDADMPVV